MGITPSRGEGVADSRDLQPLTCGYHTIYTYMCSHIWYANFARAIWYPITRGRRPEGRLPVVLCRLRVAS